jgi:TRAP-type uncharacterized transport system fused permease subunit
VIAPVTPPVAIAAYAGAGIAGSNPNKTGVKAFVFAIPAFLVPFLFVYNPVLLAEGNLPEILAAGVTAIIGSTALAASTEGYFFGKLSLPYRVLLCTSALCMLAPEAVSDILGIAIAVIIGTLAFLKRKEVKKRHVKEETA